MYLHLYAVASNFRGACTWVLCNRHPGPTLTHVCVCECVRVCTNVSVYCAPACVRVCAAHTHLVVFQCAEQGPRCPGRNCAGSSLARAGVGGGWAAEPPSAPGGARTCTRLSVSESERACVHACTAPFVCVWASVRTCVCMRACGVRTLGAVGDRESAITETWSAMVSVRFLVKLENGT